MKQCYVSFLVNHSSLRTKAGKNSCMIIILLPLVCAGNVSLVQAAQELVAAHFAANNIDIWIPVTRGNRKNKWV